MIRNRLGPVCRVLVRIERPETLPLSVVVSVIVLDSWVRMSMLGLAVLLSTNLTLVPGRVCGLTIAIGTLQCCRLVVRRLLKCLQL